MAENYTRSVKTGPQRFTEIRSAARKYL